MEKSTHLWVFEMVRVSAPYSRARVYPRVGVYEYDSLEMIESPKSIAISINFIWQPELITGRLIWSGWVDCWLWIAKSLSAQPSYWPDGSPCISLHAISLFHLELAERLTQKLGVRNLLITLPKTVRLRLWCAWMLLSMKETISNYIVFRFCLVTLGAFHVRKMFWFLDTSFT